MNDPRPNLASEESAIGRLKRRIGARGHDVAKRYRREGEVSLVELELNSIAQLFNSLDPSPFHEKDLDPEAEEYIVGAVREFPIQAPIKLVLHLPQHRLAETGVGDLARSIHNYFEYRRQVVRRDLRFHLKLGRISAAIGTLFLIACVSLRQIFLADSESTFHRIVAEGLLIAGWVAMWRPLQILLYDWWPLKHKCDIYAKLAAMPIETRPRAALHAGSV